VCIAGTQKNALTIVRARAEQQALQESTSPSGISKLLNYIAPLSPEIPRDLALDLALEQGCCRGAAHRSSALAFCATW
jgi:hypothetical protein